MLIYFIKHLLPAQPVMRYDWSASYCISTFHPLDSFAQPFPWFALESHSALARPVTYTERTVNKPRYRIRQDLDILQVRKVFNFNQRVQLRLSVFTRECSWYPICGRNQSDLASEQLFNPLSRSISSPKVEICRADIGIGEVRRISPLHNLHDILCRLRTDL